MEHGISDYVEKYFKAHIMIRKKYKVTNIPGKHYQNINLKELNNTGITYRLKKIGLNLNIFLFLVLF